MCSNPVHTCGLLTYPVLGTSPRGGADDSERMAASLRDNGAPSGGVAGSTLVPWGTPRSFKVSAIRYSHILYVSFQATRGGM